MKKGVDTDCGRSELRIDITPDSVSGRDSVVRTVLLYSVRRNSGRKKSAGDDRLLLVLETELWSVVMG